MHMVAIKWFLNVITAIYAAFIQCMCGGTSWNCMYESSKYCLRFSDTSLSMMWNFGINPRFLHLSYIFVIPFSMQGPVLFLSVVFKILLAS